MIKQHEPFQADKLHGLKMLRIGSETTTKPPGRRWTRTPGADAGSRGGEGGEARRVGHGANAQRY